MNLESLITAQEFARECTLEDDAIIIAVKKCDTVRMCVEGKPMECNKQWATVLGLQLTL